MARITSRKRDTTKPKDTIPSSNSTTSPVLRPFPPYMQCWQPESESFVKEKWTQARVNCASSGIERTEPTEAELEERIKEDESFLNHLRLPISQQKPSILAYFSRERLCLAVANQMKWRFYPQTRDSKIVRHSSLPDHIEKNVLKDLESVYSPQSSLFARFKDVKPDAYFVCNDKILMTSRYFSHRELNKEVYNRFKLFYNKHKRDKESPIDTYISKRTDEKATKSKEWNSFKQIVDSMIEAYEHMIKYNTCYYYASCLKGIVFFYLPRENRKTLFHYYSLDAPTNARNVGSKEKMDYFGNNKLILTMDFNCPIPMLICLYLKAFELSKREDTNSLVRFEELSTFLDSKI